MNALSLEGVHAHIGAYHILHGVHLVVPKGKVTMLLGRNGAGKTTTLRAIMGLWRASRGNIRFDGKEIGALPTPSISAMGVAYVPEHMGIFADLTVKE
ncbi:High-affinity branched-chain amino acid transport ATP-binding protein LivF [Bradyrhizobium ivorense]|nr:High-affinity branched-chain amino acid transport ATP-binding protein LivF [Bradyrhizobium ivorense]